MMAMAGPGAMRPAPAPPQMQTPIWFLTNGTWRLGPLTLDQTLGALQQAAQPVDVYVWREGMEGWLRPESVPELAAGLQGIPLPVPAVPPVQVAVPGGWPGPAAAPAAPAIAEPPPPPRWFVVGPVKLVVMSTVTLGLYQIFWFYKHWQQVRDVHGEDIWPVPRAIFNVLFSFTLFRRLEDDCAMRGYADAPSPMLHAVAFFVLTLTSRLPAPWWLIMFASVLPLVSIQRAANAIALQAAPGTDPNRTFSGLNWVGIVVGGLFFILAIFAAFIPEEAKAAATLAGAVVRPA
jgi:hypothetical protein